MTIVTCFLRMAIDSSRRRTVDVGAQSSAGTGRLFGLVAALLLTACAAPSSHAFGSVEEAPARYVAEWGRRGKRVSRHLSTTRLLTGLSPAGNIPALAPQPPCRAMQVSATRWKRYSIGLRCQASIQERGHLLAGHQRPRAVPSIGAPARDAGLRETVDVALVDRRIVIAEEVGRGARRANARARNDAICSRVTLALAQNSRPAHPPVIPAAARRLMSPSKDVPSSSSK